MRAVRAVRAMRAVRVSSARGCERQVRVDWEQS